MWCHDADTVKQVQLPLERLPSECATSHAWIKASLCSFIIPLSGIYALNVRISPPISAIQIVSFLRNKTHFRKNNYIKKARLYFHWSIFNDYIRMNYCPTSQFFSTQFCHLCKVSHLVRWRSSDAFVNKSIISSYINGFPFFLYPYFATCKSIPLYIVCIFLDFFRRTLVLFISGLNYLFSLSRRKIQD